MDNLDLSSYTAKPKNDGFVGSLFWPRWPKAQINPRIVSGLVEQTVVGDSGRVWVSEGEADHLTRVRAQLGRARRRVMAARGFISPRSTHNPEGGGSVLNVDGL
jgi:hypothetical protein